ncbi:MAG: CHAT domain-containing protein [Ardenticatenaceae bacterium]
MDKMRYLDFELLVERWEKGYRARVTDSPAGWASVEFTLPFSDLELENFVLRIAAAGRNVRRINPSQMEITKMFGERLFQAIFRDETYHCLVRSLDEAERQEAGLRIQLRLEAPELADLPWEYLYNPATNRFLFLSKEISLVRFLDLPGEIPPPQVERPLKVLVMIAKPLDARLLDVGQEWDNLNEALADLMREGLITLERLEYATLTALQRKLRQDTYHIFHFIGHGTFDKRSKDGLLLLEDEKGMGASVSGQTVGTLLGDERSLRLVVLNACEGARTSRTDPFAGVAQSLLQQGTPAVIAMQFEVSDKTALTFAHEFYAALADNYPAEAALGEARKAIYSQGHGAEWGAPVLYLRTPNGRIFDIAPSRHPKTAETPNQDTDKTETSPELPPERAQSEGEKSEPGEEEARKGGNSRAALIMVPVASIVLLILATLLLSEPFSFWFWPDPPVVKSSPTAQPTHTIQVTQTNTTPAPTSSPDMPPWAAITPTPALPAEAIILSVDLDNCPQTVNFADHLEEALEEVGLESDVKVRSSEVRGDELRAEAEEVEALAAVWGECVEGQTNVTVSILFAGDSPYPVSLLQEPKELTLRAEQAKVKHFAQAGVLYAVGRYEEAETTLQYLAQEYKNTTDQANLTGFNWLWGNISLRLENWPEAHDAYTRALDGLKDDSPLKPKLLANRGASALLAKQPDLDPLVCKTMGREDLEDALSLNKERAEGNMFQSELHVLLGTIMLDCPANDGDIEINAGAQAERALGLNPDSALVYAFKAKVGAYNGAKLDIGDPLTVQSHACEAIKRDHKLPDPHRTLGIIYAEYGLPDQARKKYKKYGQLSTLKSQREDAARRWSTAHRATNQPREDLGECN